MFDEQMDMVDYRLEKMNKIKALGARDILEIKRSSVRVKRFDNYNK